MPNILPNPKQQNVSTSRFPTHKLESSAKTHSSVKAIAKFGAYPDIGCTRNLWNHPQAMVSDTPVKTQKFHKNLKF